MERFVKGDVVVVPFPFSDLSGFKRRPALVAATISGDDTILCLITSKDRKDAYSVKLEESDFMQGKLPLTSVIRPNRLFGAEKSIISYKIGVIKETKAREVEEKLVKMIRS